MMINEVERYVNTSALAETISPTTVTYESGRAGIIMTPFFVRILGNDSFVVLAIGDSLVSPSVGMVTRPFSATPQCLILQPGWVLGIGYMDANPDGSNSVHSVVRWENCCDEIWYSGGPGANDSGSITVGQPPTPGPRILTHLRRKYILDYQFDISN